MQYACFDSCKVVSMLFVSFLYKVTQINSTSILKGIYIEKLNLWQIVPFGEEEQNLLRTLANTKYIGSYICLEECSSDRYARVAMPRSSRMSGTKAVIICVIRLFFWLRCGTPKSHHHFRDAQGYLDTVITHAYQGNICNDKPARFILATPDWNRLCTCWLGQ